MKKIILPIIGFTVLITGSALINKKEPKGINMESLDLSVPPGEDFFRFANGTWLKNNPIPASESRWGSFNEVADRNNEILKTILEDAAKQTNAPVGSTIQKVGTFYRLFMDTAKRNAIGIEPIVADLQQINHIKSTTELIEVVAKFHKKGVRSMFGFGVGQDLKNSTSYIVYISQGGLSLPDRDYYLKQDEKSVKIRLEFEKHIEAIAGLYNNNTVKPLSVFTIETELAKVSMTRTERRNQEKQYNKRSYQQIVNTYPNLNFALYCKTIGIKNFDSLIVSQPEFFNSLNQLLISIPLEDWKTYLTWHVMNNASGRLNTALERQNFYFTGTVLTGAKEQKPLWKRGIAASNGIVGDLLGELFVKKAFAESSKIRVNNMVTNIVAAFKIRINNLDWMSEPTKAKAQEKLASFNRKFGYPDKWKDYTALEIKDDSYLANDYRASEFAHNDMIDKLGKPIDRDRWGMTPQTVNAYYSATLNEIVFPAAIMQPPFFDPETDEAVNYGSIGAVIGHELTHGFDDQGSKYGADGNMKSWWTEEDRTKFDARTKVLANQYSNYEVLPGLNINGELTLGENIADLGGLTIAYDAFKMYLANNPKANKVINGYTPEQRFFIGFAQVWKTNQRPEYLRNQILTDPHSPGEYRVKGTLGNMPTFYDAFKITEKDKMYIKPEARVKIW